MFMSAGTWAAKSLCRKQIAETIRRQSTISINQNIDKAVRDSVLITKPLAPSESKWLPVSLDKPRHSQMNYMELSLFKKHVKYLQVDQQKTIYDVIDGIELNYLVTEAHLEKAVQILNDPKCNVKKLIDSDLALLISTTGCRCQMLSAAQRNEYTILLLHVFKKKGVKLGINARNALLAAQIDNKIELDVVEILKQFESSGLVPDAQTYSQLSRVYAQKADFKGIFEIINHVRNIGLELPSQMLESMVYSLSSSGHHKKAKLVIEQFASNTSLADSLKMAYTLAKAELFNDGNVLELLDMNTDVAFIQKHQIPIYELLFCLARKENLEAIIKLKSLSSLSEGLDNQWGSIVYSRIRKLLSKEEENYAAAALLLDLIPNTEKRSKVQFFLTKQFLPFIQSKQIPEAVRVCTIFQKCNILKHPLRTYVNHVAFNNPKNFHDLFAIYKRTDDFMKLQNRPHLQLPDAVQHFNELMKADTLERRAEHLLEIARFLRSTGIATCGCKYFANVKDLFLIPILNDMDTVPHLLEKIGNDNLLQCFVVDVLVTYLLATKRMQQLQLLVHGALKNSSAGEAYPCQEIKNFILNTSVYNKSLVPTCSLLRLLFPLSGASNNPHYRKGVQIIKAAIIAGDLNKVKMMCELWSADRRIVLRKIDKDDILRTLHRNGELSKQQFVTTLLEKVAMNQSVRQKPMRNTDNASQKRVEEKLQNALHSNDLEKATEIWVTGSEHISPCVGLLFAEKLYFSKLVDQFKSVLLKLNELHEDLSFHVLTAYDSSDASDARMVFLSEVSTVLDLHLNVKQELLNNTRVSAFQKLIEKGDLKQALDLLKMISAQKNSVFGQFDLMGAAIERDDIAVISEVLNLITTYHGKESSLADFLIVLLEHYKKVHATRLVQSSSFRLSGAKLNYYIDREIHLDRVEVILDLFELCISKGNLEQRDLEHAVSKIISFYVKRKNKTKISLVEERLKNIGVPLTPEMDSLLSKSKQPNFGITDDKNARVS